MMEAAGYHTESSLGANHTPDRAYLTAMAEAVTTGTQDHSDYSTSLPASPGQKRKRGLPDSPVDFRRPKRSNAAAPSMSSNHHDNTDSADYVETAVEAAQQAAAAANVSNADFTALQQASSDHHHHDPSDPANASSTAAAALGYPTLHVPQSTEETFAAQVANEAEHHHDSSSYNGNDLLSHHSLETSDTHNGMRSMHSAYHNVSQANKPAVGSEEWHKQRKDNHKEVERRRRETINEGINELAKIVPGCEKNKGSILQRAVAFITQLKENEAQNIEKWTLEKLLTEQAIQELGTANDKLKQECDRAYREMATWKHLAQSAGLHPDQAKEEHNSSS